ncbi:MAG TPA: hypothetical protein VMR62_30835 [Bryobacteraceae bacterium]|nr:hypothetical protein [Bryobacteraceae bacterium]
MTNEDFGTQDFRGAGGASFLRQPVMVQAGFMTLYNFISGSHIREGRQIVVA